jgi:hypothetical protein
MNKKMIKIGIVALLMLVISGSVVSAWPWSRNETNWTKLATTSL